RVSRPTVDLWLSRYEAEGIGGLVDRPQYAESAFEPVGVLARAHPLPRRRKIVLGPLGAGILGCIQKAVGEAVSARKMGLGGELAQHRP
ncbi:MAG: helix-turn-helix domain-containing protein, partial [Pseudonocardiales bacterium]|nr:helix-turn-helix domain-containing protein [Pseudonocardiales bacterium]